MTTHAWLLLGLFLAILIALAQPLGVYLAAVLEGRAGWASRIGRPLETGIYRLCGVRENQAIGWLPYALALLLFNGLGLFAVYALQRLQLWLPLNPQQFGNVSPDSAFNTAVSFVTNTNWQGYGGESTMSYLTQTLGRKPISACGGFQRRRFRDSSSERGAWRWDATNSAILNGRRSSRIFPTSRAACRGSMIGAS